VVFGFSARSKEKTFFLVFLRFVVCFARAYKMNVEDFFGGAIGGMNSYLMGDDEGSSGMNMVGAAAAAAEASNPFMFDQDPSMAAPGAAGAAGMPGVSGTTATPDEPIFNPARVEYAFTRLVHMAIASKHVVLAFATNKVQLFSLDRPGNITEVEVTRRSDDQILKAFIDPSGNHILVTTRCEENFYLHWGSNKVRPLTKMRGVIIESVAWDMQNTSMVPTASPTVASMLGQSDPTAVETSGEGTAMLTAAQTTRNFLIGTRNGGIYEVCIEAPPERRMMDLMSKQEYLFRQIHTLDGAQPVTGIRFERFPPTPDHPIKYFVMATTATRLYEFVGGPTFEAMMIPYEQNPGFMEMPPVEYLPPIVSLAINWHSSIVLVVLLKHLAGLPALVSITETSSTADRNRVRLLLVIALSYSTRCHRLSVILQLLSL